MRIEIGQILTQILSFLIMLWILRRYAWKPIISRLEARKNKIQSEIDSIEAQKLEADKLAAEYREKLKEIDIYARIKTQEAIEEGRQASYKIQEEAHMQARAIIAKAQADLQKEVFKAKMQLKNELVDITVAATEKILQTGLDKEQQKNLVADFIEQIGSN